MATWKCRDGRELEFCEMEDSHIINSIRMMRRKGFVSLKEVSSYLTADIDSMGDGAQMCFMQELDQVLDRPISKGLDYLLDEAKRRGLSCN